MNPDGEQRHLRQSAGGSVQEKDHNGQQEGKTSSDPKKSNPSGRTKLRDATVAIVRAGLLARLGSNTRILYKELESNDVTPKASPCDVTQVQRRYDVNNVHGDVRVSKIGKNVGSYHLPKSFPEIVYISKDYPVTLAEFTAAVDETLQQMFYELIETGAADKPTSRDHRKLVNVGLQHENVSRLFEPDKEPEHNVADGTVKMTDTTCSALKEQTLCKTTKGDRTNIPAAIPKLQEFRTNKEAHISSSLNNDCLEQAKHREELQNTSSLFCTDTEKEAVTRRARRQKIGAKLGDIDCDEDTGKHDDGYKHMGSCRGSGTWDMPFDESCVCSSLDSQDGCHPRPGNARVAKAHPKADKYKIGPVESPKDKDNGITKYVRNVLQKIK